AYNCLQPPAPPAPPLQQNRLFLPTDVVLPWEQKHFGNANWTFQQDSTPAHKVKKTQEWCKANFPYMISSEEGSPYKPDVNPMDYSVLSSLESKACTKPHKTLDSLKQSLLRECDRLNVKELRPIDENFCKRFCL
ncbi:uncharacterized protein TNCV_1957861, partial [Trichonephila clavipes]